MDPRNFYLSLQRPARIGLIIGMVALLALTIATLWWVMTPRQQLLFGNMNERDAAEVVASLNEWKVPHTITDGGAGITVAADQVYDTRMRLVSAGVPRGGHVGFELFDDSDFGVTEFAQRVNYQRALQGEIERTIAALPGVTSARVHLTIRRPGLFANQHDDSKASVALALEPGQRLTRKQINGVRSLVAASVEGLAPTQVSVLDSDGGLLAAASADGANDADLQGHAEEDQRLENRLTDHMRAILDGHVVLSRDLAARGHHPAIDVLHSASRVMDAVASGDELALAREARRHLALYEASRDLIELGAHQKGANPALDRVIEQRPHLEAVLQQPPSEATPREAAYRRLAAALQGAA